MKRIIADMRRKRDLRRAINAGRTLMLKEQKRRPGLRPPKKSRLNWRRAIRITAAVTALIIIVLCAATFFGLVDLDDILSSNTTPAVQLVPHADELGPLPDAPGRSYVTICQAMGLVDCDTTP